MVRYDMDLSLELASEFRIRVWIISLAFVAECNDS